MFICGCFSRLSRATDFDEVAIGIVYENIARAVVRAHARTGGNAHAFAVERGDDAIEVGDFKGDVAARRAGVFFGEDQVDFDVATAIPGTCKVVIWPGEWVAAPGAFRKNADARSRLPVTNVIWLTRVMPRPADSMRLATGSILHQ